MLLTDSFLDYLLHERNYSKGTVEYYRADILELQRFGEEMLGDLTPLDVDAELVREWIASLMDKGLASNTINRKLSSVRTYYKFLLRRGKVAVDPLRKVTGPKKKKPLPVFLREGEMNRLLDDMDFGEGFEGCRDHMIIEMFYATGMRLSELIGLDDKDVDFSASLVKVTGKRNKQRLIPFDEKKADEALYKKRLEICTECDCLINGMCSKCGCFVEMRAAFAINRCPHEDKLW